MDRRGIHYYFQVTLNDYEKEGFEPNVPPIQFRLDAFKELSDVIGKERVIWRFDPLIMTKDLTPHELLTRIWHIGNKLKGKTDKLVFSFVDIKAYRKVQKNLINETELFTKRNVELAEGNKAQRREIVEGLVKIREAWKAEGWNLTIATCAEAEELERYGIEHNRCIDGELMKSIFSEDEDFVYYLNTLKWPVKDMFGQLPPLPTRKKNVKDKGQRKYCGCMVSKDIGIYNTCRHFCVYCYANSNNSEVKKNSATHNDISESIIDSVT